MTAQEESMFFVPARHEETSYFQENSVHRRQGKRRLKVNV